MKKLVALLVIVMVVAMNTLIVVPVSALTLPYDSSACGSKNDTIGLNQSSTGRAIRIGYRSTKKYGSTGTCVKHIQESLNAYFCTSGTKLVADGIYGAKTKRAVYRLQQVAKSKTWYEANPYTVSIKVDGIYGPQSYGLTYVAWTGWLGGRASCE